MDISNPIVQLIRENVLIGNKPLHDYVPLFFAKRTPMMYALIKQEEIKFQNIHVLIIKPEILFLDDVFFTDGNAAAGGTKFYSNNQLEKLDELSWNLILSGSWNHPNVEVKKDRKRRICAELLVPFWVSPNWIERIIPYNKKLIEFFF